MIKIKIPQALSQRLRINSASFPYCLRMGCGTSKAAVVVANTTMEPQSSKMKKVAMITGAESPPTNTGQGDPPASTEISTLDSETGMKYGSSSEFHPSSSKTTSAVSRQNSAKSKDSGLGGDTELDRITADKPSPDLKHEVNVSETSIRTNSKKIKIPGPVERRKRNTIKLPPVKSRVKAKEDLDLEVILQKRVKFADALINELPTTNSIVKRPVSRGGVAFDIVMGDKESDTEAPPIEEVAGRLPPLCVQNYARKQRLADTVTKVELEKKQRAAEQRRRVSRLHLHSKNFTEDIFLSGLQLKT